MDNVDIPLEPIALTGWARFRQRHFYDYPAPALRLWFVIAFAGAGVLGWALHALASAPLDDIARVAVGLVLVALAAMVPIQIPRTAHIVLVADVFVFVILVLLGPAAAAVAACIEGSIGTLRGGKRLTSRVSGPASATLAMAACGLCYEALRDALQAVGMAAPPAQLTALCVASIVPVLLSTGPLIWLMALKRGVPFRLRDWFDASTWFAAIVLFSAFIGALIAIDARRHGPAVLVVASVLAFSLALLLRTTLRRHEGERVAQEALLTGAQAEAEANQKRFTAAFTHAAIGMAIVRPAGPMLQVNRALCELLGYDEATLVGKPFGAVLHDGDVELFERRVADAGGLEDSAFSMELRCSTRDGGDLWAVLHCSLYEDPGGAGQCLIHQLHDITSRHVAESRLHHIAYHDGLTDLANRNCFQERLAVAVERSRLDGDVRFAVLFLDLDRFKIVNDSLGHSAGNQLLHEVARRLSACVRPCDLVARLGGDEFAVLLEALHDTGDGLRLAERLLAEVAMPMPINGTEILPGASIGITFSDLGYRTVDEVLRDADLAMYEAKAAGRGRVVLFDSSMHERVAEKLALEADLRHAIGEGQLSVQFQPLYELQPYRLYGFEALARWVHPVRGPVSPAVFIALAEETGHIEALTDWVIDHSVSQLAQWQAAIPAAAGLGVHVNISGRDMTRPSLVTHVHEVLQRHGLKPEQLTLEITETTLMGRLEEALGNLHLLRNSGVRFSIDDFGTGYSSLAYLSTLPIDSLKIDRSFVMNMQAKPENVEIIRAVLTLAQSLGHRVVAEGIETAEQLRTLRALGVDIGQGYLLSRPLRGEQVTALLETAAEAVA